MDIDRRNLIQGIAGAAAATMVAVATTGAAAAESDLYVIADLLAKPEKADEFRKIIVDFVEGARKENGCKHYTLLEDPAKPGHFYTFEIWTDKAALDAHLNSPAIKAIGPKLQEVLAAPPVITPLKLMSE